MGQGLKADVAAHADEIMAAYDKSSKGRRMFWVGGSSVNSERFVREMQAKHDRLARHPWESVRREVNDLLSSKFGHSRRRASNSQARDTRADLFADASLDVHEVARRATESLAQVYRYLGIADPPAVTVGVVNHVIKAMAEG